MFDRKILAVGSGWLLAAGLLAGCGGAPAQAASTTSSGKQSDGLQFAQCMRSHGIDVPDPGSGGGGVRIQVGGPDSSGGINPNSSQFQQAQTACQKYLPGMNLTPQQQQQAQQNALAYAQCMRGHGVDVPDPQVTSHGVQFSLGTLSPSDPAFQSAQNACSSKLGNVPVMIQGGGGPGGGGGGEVSSGFAVGK